MSQINRSASREELGKCLALYESVRDKRYVETRPKLHLDEIRQNDEWRYNELPRSAVKAGCLTKSQLAGLVKWKITHGVHRPFLPGMVQKNSEEDVAKFTALAADQVKEISINDETDGIISTAEAALAIACKLKGVGPATGSLILNTFAPDLVPFFEDELFKWLNPDHKIKLKYDKKEYVLLLRAALDLMKQHSLSAQDLEKIAYVVVNEKYLTDQQKISMKTS